MDEWDTYVAEIEAMGLDELKAIHETRYARLLAAQQGKRYPLSKKKLPEFDL